VLFRRNNKEDCWEWQEQGKQEVQKEFIQKVYLKCMIERLKPGVLFYERVWKE
jgi:hypothetical protein